MTSDQKYEGKGNTAPSSLPAAENAPSAAQNSPFAGFALSTIDGLELLTPDELQAAVHAQLPANLPVGMAPTLQPNDRVILTPLSLMTDPIGAVVFLQLNNAPYAYVVGRLSERDNDEWVLTDNLPDSEVWVSPDQIVSAWAVRLIVNRKVC